MSNAPSLPIQGPRHTLLVRVTHWITVISFIALLITGFEILISHPRFYWGEVGHSQTAPLFKVPIPSSRATVPSGYGYVLPDQNGWSRYLHFEAAWAFAPDSGGIYGPGETLTYAAQRLFARHSLAREFPRSMISKVPFANSISPLNDEFKRLQAGGFSDWRLTVDGMVARPASLSLADLRTFAIRSQITEVVCEEGWSYVAEWIGTPLSDVLNGCGLLPRARYIVYFSIEPDWWESIDMNDAQHPQTLLSWAMNGGDLPVPFGGPLRLRVPRQLGYKSVKFVTRIMATDSLKGFVSASDPKSPNYGYAWYAGI